MIRRIAISLVLCLIAVCGELRSQQADSAVLFRFRGTPLRGSKWGSLAVFQRALSDSVRGHGSDSIAADGLFGRRTCLCIASYLHHLDSTTATDSTITEHLWHSVLPGVPLPGVHERAFTVSLTFEATDYDVAEWNYGTRDDGSALTWGPFGATIGWGNEVRAIARMIHRSDSTLMPHLFGNEWKTMKRVLDSSASASYAILLPVFTDTARRAAWKAIIRKLGATDTARACYDRYALTGNDWLKPNLRRLISLIPDADTTMTEIDYAFFLDLSMHVSVTPARIQSARDAIGAREKKLKRAVNASERRRIIGDVFANATGWKRDRTGRNVVYYIDGIGEDNLSDYEREAWQWRSGSMRASDAGLSDGRKYYPL